MKKQSIPLCNILGIQIAAVNMETALAYIRENLPILYGKYICISNVHTTVMGYENNGYGQIQDEAALALPDGRPLSILCKRRGFPNADRVAGPDLMRDIFACSQEHGYTHYFYGSTPETLEILEQKLKDEYALSIVGMYSPPFRKMTKEEDKDIIDKINQTQPDFIWVGLGAPKQEYWMYEHRNKLHGLMIGVGAGFDYFAGNIKRAPLWMQNCSLEWLYRLFQEPKRLFKRYLVTNTKFLWLILRGK